MTTIYFAGTEDVDFTLVGANVVNTGGNYRTAWVRAGILGSVSTTDPPANRAVTPVFTSISAFWVHCQYVQTSTTGVVANGVILRVLDSGGVARLVLRETATSGTWGMWTRNAAGTFTQLGSNFVTGLVLGGVSAPLDLDINYSASGHVNVWFAGVQVFTYSGNITTDSATTLAQVDLCGAGTTNTVYSEVIVADSDTRSMGLWLLNSSTSGTNTQWTGTASNVNKATINDATFITSATAAQINEYKTGGIALPAGTYAVVAVVTAMRVLVSTTGPQHVDMGFNFNGTRYWSSDYAPSAGFGNFPNLVWATNPNTSAAWTTADLTAATFNYGVQSTT
jgi:hypothetical protein